MVRNVVGCLLNSYPQNTEDDQRRHGRACLGRDLFHIFPAGVFDEPFVFWAPGAALAKGLSVEAKAANPEANGASVFCSVLVLSARRRRFRSEGSHVLCMLNVMLACMFALMVDY